MMVMEVRAIQEGSAEEEGRRGGFEGGGGDG